MRGYESGGEVQILRMELQFGPAGSEGAGSDAAISAKVLPFNAATGAIEVKTCGSTLAILTGVVEAGRDAGLLLT